MFGPTASWWLIWYRVECVPFDLDRSSVCRSQGLRRPAASLDCVPAALRCRPAMSPALSLPGLGGRSQHFGCARAEMLVVGGAELLLSGALTSSGKLTVSNNLGSQEGTFLKVVLQVPAIET